MRQAKNYQNLESYYNEFVYHTYLDMPERIQRTLSSLLGEAKIPEGEKHVDYSEAKENILYLLTSAYTDSNQLDERWTGDDFIFDFLADFTERIFRSFCKCSDHDVSLLRIPATICGRISDHAGGCTGDDSWKNRMWWMIRMHMPG